MIRIYCSKADATLLETETLTAGMVNTPSVLFTFSSDWNGLGKTAIVRAGTVIKEVVLDNDQITVPAECLAKAGVNLIIGVWGGNFVTELPTVWCACGEIQDSTNPSAASNHDEPTASNVAQMLGLAERAEEALSGIEDIINQAEQDEQSIRTLLEIVPEHIDDNSEAWAVGTRFGVDVPSTDPTYHNNSKYYSEHADLAKNQAVSARTDAVSAKEDAVTAKTAAQTAQAAAESAAATAYDELIETIPTAVDDWLEDNISQETGYVLDATLTSSEAAAPADKVGELKDTIVNYNSIDVLNAKKNGANKTQNDVIFTWDNGTCHITGTVGGSALCNIINNSASLPEGVKPGDKLYFKYNGKWSRLRIYVYREDTTYTYFETKTNLIYTVPSYAVGMTVRIQITSDLAGKTLNEYVTPLAFTGKTNRELSAETEDLKNSVSVSNFMPDGRKLLETIKKCFSSFVPLANTPATGATEQFDSGTEYSGVLYASTHYYSRDAFFNYSLESIFTMFKNPDSILYTYPTEHDGAMFTGGVCSSWTSWICGLPLFYTTDDITKLLNYKTIHDLSEIELGDVLVCHERFDDTSMNHALIVSNIFTNADGVYAIEITEEWKPTMRRIIYTASQFWGLFDGTTREDDFYHLGRLDNVNIRTIPPLIINSDIISEYGDNAYFEYGDDIFVKSANSSFSALSPSGESSIISFSTMPAKANTSMRNIKTALDEVGRWTLYGSNSEESHITIIKKGTASLVADVVTLADYEGCTPCAFAVVGVYRDTSTTGKYDSHLVDHSAMRLVVYSKDDQRYAGAIDSDSFTIDSSGISTSRYIAYYVRIFYDTGCGQAWQDTNLQYFD